MQLLVLPIFDPQCHCSLVIAIWAYRPTVILSHYRTIIGRSTQKNWMQLKSRKITSRKRGFT